MIRNIKTETMRTKIVVPRIRMARHADRESVNVKEAKVWKRGAQRIILKTILRTILRTVLKTILRTILRSIVKIEIGTSMDATNMNAHQNVNAVVIVLQNAIVNDRHKQSMMAIARVKNEKYPVNEAKR